MSCTQVQTRLGSLAVRVRGEGPTAVLWHSLFVDERSWRRVEEALGRDRRLVIITGPGHGASPDPGRRYSLDDCAAAAGRHPRGTRDRRAGGLGRQCLGRARGGGLRVGVARSMQDAGHPRDADPGLRSVRTDRRSGRCWPSIASSAWSGFLSSGIRDALLSPRTRANDPEAVALVLDSLRSMRRRALGNAMESISLRRPDLIRAARRDPLPHAVRDGK